MIFSFLLTRVKRKMPFVNVNFLGNAQNIEIWIVPNRGRDIAPKLITFADTFARYDLTLFIHTKRSLHHSILADWRKVILSQLVGTKVIVNDILGLFSVFPDLGIVAPMHFEPILKTLGGV